MKISLRIPCALSVILLLIGLAVGPVCAQVPDPKYDSLFAAARALETDQPNKAFEAYQEVKHKAKDDIVAAEALLRAALFASSPKYGTTEDLRAQGERQAHETYKQLLQHYPNEPAAKYVKEQRLQEQLEERIDKRNSTHFSYKLVDMLVAATGRFSGFSYWFALLFIAAVVKLLTFPLTLRMYKSQREMQRMQPIVKELQEQYKNDKVKLHEKTMAAYREHGVNPLASCLPLVVQLPFLYWIYETIRLYEFHFSHGTFLWIGSSLSHRYPEFLAISLGHFDVPLLVLYAASNYLTMRLTPSSDPQAAAMQKQMSIMMTIFMFWMFMTYRWSAAFIFYWLALNIISTYQQYKYIYKPNQTAGGGPPTSGGSGGTTTTSPETTAKKNGGSERSQSNGAGPSSTRPVTPVPGGEGMRARPRRKKR